MKREVVKTARIGAGLLLAFALAGCLTDPVAGPGGDRPARVTFEVVSDAAGQAGGIVPDVNRLVIVMTSSTRDTLRDTVTAAGSRLSTEPAWLDGTAGRVHLFVRYDLAPGRRWNIDVSTRDANDSVIHRETVRLDDLRAFEYRSARVALASRWVGYAAHVTLPAAMTAGGVSRPVRFGRVELRVDGVVVRDTVVSATTRDLLLSHPYVAPGAHAIDFRAYGVAEGTTGGITVGNGEGEGVVDGTAFAMSPVLLKGSTTIDVALGQAATGQAVALDWSDADAGSAEASGASLRLGAVGTVTMNVTVPGAINI